MRKVNTMRFTHVGVLLAALLIAWHGAPGALMAKDRCQISVETILAARDNAGIDPQLRRHVGELQNMFNYTSYRLLSSERLNLQTGETGTVALPGQRRLKITPQKVRGSRADIAMQMLKQDRTVFQTQVQILNRGSLFVGGPKFQNGNLIFRISSAY